MSARGIDRAFFARSVTQLSPMRSPEPDSSVDTTFRLDDWLCGSLVQSRPAGLLESMEVLRGLCWSRLPTFIPALPFCHAELRTPKPQLEHYPKEINTLGDHIRTRRLDLKLLQRELRSKSVSTQPRLRTGNATHPPR